MRPVRDFATRYGVNIHGWCLMHNHGHWIFEASSEDSISNLMRDMQSGYSRYLNRRYRAQPWKLLAPLTLYGRRARKMFSPYWRAGPVNWSPRFDAMFLDGAGFKMFLRYLENNRAPQSAVTQRDERPAPGGHRVCLDS